MVVGIIGILAAVAIPAYQTYQKNAQAGVVESFLQTALRTINVNQSLGTVTTAGDLDQKIRTKNASAGTWSIEPDPIPNSGNDWCVAVDPGGSDFPKGCIQGDSVIAINQEIDCSKYKTIAANTCQVSSCTGSATVGAACSGGRQTAAGTCNATKKCS